MAIEIRHLVRQLLGAPEVIGIEKRDQRRMRLGDAEISRGGNAGMASGNDVHPRVRE